MISSFSVVSAWPRHASSDDGETTTRASAMSVRSTSSIDPVFVIEALAGSPGRAGVCI